MQGVLPYHEELIPGEPIPEMMNVRNYLLQRRINNPAAHEAKEQSKQTQRQHGNLSHF